MPGVKDVVDNIKVSPVSGFDDRIRISALRAIYRDPVLGRYASDPAKPIRIVVDNGKLSLYGTVATAMDKQIAGMRANQVFGVFSVAEQPGSGERLVMQARASRSCRVGSEREGTASAVPFFCAGNLPPCPRCPRWSYGFGF